MFRGRHWWEFRAHWILKQCLQRHLVFCRKLNCENIQHVSEDSITVGNSVLIKVSGAEDEVDKEVIVSWWFEVSTQGHCPVWLEVSFEDHQVSPSPVVKSVL